jgi:hypothetical protein
MKKHRKTFRSLVVIVLALLIAAATYAFTASNTFSGPTDKAGSGTDTVSGYAVSNIHYTLDSSSKISQVAFDLDAAAGQVQVTMGGTMYPCSAAVGPLFHVTCPISPSADPVPVASLTVAAVS